MMLGLFAAGVACGGGLVAAATLLLAGPPRVTAPPRLMAQPEDQEAVEMGEFATEYRRV